MGKIIRFYEWKDDFLVDFAGGSFLYLDLQCQFVLDMFDYFRSHYQPASKRVITQLLHYQALRLFKALYLCGEPFVGIVANALASTAPNRFRSFFAID